MFPSYPARQERKLTCWGVITTLHGCKCLVMTQKEMATKVDSSNEFYLDNSIKPQQGRGIKHSSQTIFSPPALPGIVHSLKRKQQAHQSTPQLSGYNCLQG